MVSQAFEGALDDPDNHASHLRLRELLCCTNSSNFDSPVVAEKYLRAFCETAATAVRRRWIGIALAWMLKGSSSVVDHIQRLRNELQGLGATILSQTEREETKIVAGIIIRQGIERGIEYDCFWLSEKVKNSASNFPKDCGSRWMSEFQDFLDTLDELALTNPIADPSIIYPISLIASDDFKWQPPGNGFATAIIQAGIMTVIAPDDLLCDVRFVDIPIAHICNLQARRSSLYDSQARTTEHEPWDLTMALKGKTWTYSVDASRRTGDEMTVLFQHSGDAKEWEGCIKEHVKASRDSISRIHPMMSKSSPINLGPRHSPQSNAVQATQGQKFATQPQPSVQVSPSLGSDMSNHVNQNASPPPSHIPRARHSREAEHTLLEQPNADTESHQVLSVGRPLELAQSQHGLGNDSSTTGQNEHEILSIQDRKLTRSAKTRSRKSPRKAEEAKMMHQQRNRQATQGVESFTSEEMSDEMVPSSLTARAHLVSNQATQSKGKLQKVSQATKLKASQQLRAHSDKLDLPNEDEDESDVTSSKAKPHKQPQKPKVPNHKPAIGSKGSKSQTKRKAHDDDDDDEFVPNEAKTKKQTGRKRKSKSDAVVGGSMRPKKKARTEAGEGAPGDAETANPTRASVAVQRSSQTRSNRLRHSRTAPIEKPPSSIGSSRHPLIDGLLGAQQPLNAPVAQFKKPELPVQTSESSSTPPQPKNRIAEARERLQTPIDVERRHRDIFLNHDQPSPTPRGVTTSKERHRNPPSQVVVEILSSNSKPVPASPNAESTAISSHADGDDVDLDKERGELQIAQNNPFGRQRKSQKVNPFMRRLTGEETQGDELVHEVLHHSTPNKTGIYDGSDIDQATPVAKSQPLPQLVPWLRKEPTRASAINPLPDLIAQLKASKKQEVQSREKRYENTGCLGHNQPQHLPNTIDAQISVAEQRNTDQHVNGSLAGKPLHNAHHHTSTQVAPETLVPPRDIATAMEKVEIRNSALVGPQHAVDDTQVNDAVEEVDGVDLDGETTLINHDEDDNTKFEPRASPVQFRSSPPVPGTPSSRSSTSAEHSPTSQPSLPTSEAEEMQWESSLQPHQRAIHDLLMRTSKRVLRHIVDNETAVTDIADVFSRDGEHVLNTLLQQHEADYDRVFHDMENKAKGLKKGLEASLKQLTKERSRINAMS